MARVRSSQSPLIHSFIGPVMPAGRVRRRYQEKRLSSQHWRWVPCGHSVAGGITPEDNREIALALEADGQLDFFDVSVGSYYSFDQFIGGMHEPHGYELARSTVTTCGSSLPVCASLKNVS